MLSSGAAPGCTKADHQLFFDMNRLRRSSCPPICLALVMGLALVWPDVAHRRFHEQHEHVHDHSASGKVSPLSPLISGSKHGDSHPHLDLTATTPTKVGLQLIMLVSEQAALDEPTMALVCVSTGGGDPIRPRSPPSGPQPPIRAPPLA